MTKEHTGHHSLTTCGDNQSIDPPDPGFGLETDLERRIAQEPRWQLGLDWGRPRPGHPEGSIRLHIRAVLANVDAFFCDSTLRPQLRLITLVHDTFKHEVDPDKFRSGENHHGMIARRFAEPLIDDDAVLDVIELHDEAYNSWQKGARDKRWDRAEERAAALIQRLGPTRDLYVAFYRCDNSVEGKSSDCFRWFQQQLARRYPAS
jgi:hypothetical protein